MIYMVILRASLGFLQKVTHCSDGGDKSEALWAKMNAIRPHDHLICQPKAVIMHSGQLQVLQSTAHQQLCWSACHHNWTERCLNLLRSLVPYSLWLDASKPTFLCLGSSDLPSLASGTCPWLLWRASPMKAEGHPQKIQTSCSEF